MSILKINAGTIATNNRFNTSNILNTKGYTTSPINLSFKSTPATDVFIPSQKTSYQRPFSARFFNNFRADKTPEKFLDLDKIVQDGEKIDVTRYPDGKIKEKVLLNKKGIEFKQTFYPTGKQQSEYITDKRGPKSHIIKETNCYENGKLKYNNEYDDDSGKHLEQTFYENGNTKTEKIQQWSLLGWHDVRKTDYYSNGNVKTNIEHNTLNGKHYHQTYDENGKLISETIR